MTSADRISIFVVAPAMMCFAVEKLVETQHPKFSLTGTSTSLAQAHTDPHAQDAEIVVVDTDELEGDTPMSVIATHSWQTIVLTSARDAGALEEALRAGVSGVVRKSDPPVSLLKAIERVHQGELWIDRSLIARLFGGPATDRRVARDPMQSRIATLTRRERQIIAALLQEQTSCGKVIACSMHISERTLRNHLTSIYSKLNIQNRLSLHALAARHHLGYVEPERPRTDKAGPPRSRDRLAAGPAQTASSARGLETQSRTTARAAGSV